MVDAFGSLRSLILNRSVGINHPGLRPPLLSRRGAFYFSNLSLFFTCNILWKAVDRLRDARAMRRCSVSSTSYSHYFVRGVVICVVKPAEDLALIGDGNVQST